MPLALPAAGPPLPAATDLRRDGEQAMRGHAPLVVLYSRSGCHWCEQARNYLVPLARDGKTTAMFREVSVDSDAALTDFAGRTTTQRRFAAAEKVRFAPTVIVHGGTGERLAEPIVGMRLPDFYGQYLEQAIAEAREKLARAAPAGAPAGQNEQRETTQ